MLKGVAAALWKPCLTYLNQQLCNLLVPNLIQSTWTSICCDFHLLAAQFEVSKETRETHNQGNMVNKYFTYFHLISLDILICPIGSNLINASALGTGGRGLTPDWGPTMLKNERSLPAV